jgi:VanZ family protein
MGVDEAGIGQRGGRRRLAEVLMRVPAPVRFLSGAAFFLLVAVLFVGGAQPEAAGMFDAHWDKLAHFGYFALLAVFAMLASGLRFPALALIAVVVVGLADELAQTQLPGRHANLPDLAFDLAGAVCAVFLLLALQRRYAARR